MIYGLQLLHNHAHLVTIVTPVTMLFDVLMLLTICQERWRCRILLPRDKNRNLAQLDIIVSRVSPPPFTNTKITPLLSYVLKDITVKQGAVHQLEQLFARQVISVRKGRLRPFWPDVRSVRLSIMHW